jgi:hypothetical protein
MVESGVDVTLVAVPANTVKVLEAVERLEAGPLGHAEAFRLSDSLSSLRSTNSSRELVF